MGDIPCIIPKVKEIIQEALINTPADIQKAWLS